jgi:O-antigen/teichoic acid export membrane protein
VYSVAVQFVDLVSLLPVAFGTVLFVSMTHSPDPARMTARAGRYVLIALSALATLLAAGGPSGLSLLFGRAFEAAYLPLLVRLPGAVALGFQTIIVQYFNTRAYPWFLTKYWLVGLAVNVAINLATIPAFGAMGAAAAGTAASATVACLVWVRFARSTGLSLRSLWKQ